MQNSDQSFINFPQLEEQANNFCEETHNSHTSTYLKEMLAHIIEQQETIYNRVGELQEQIIMQNNSYSSTLYQMYQNLQQQETIYNRVEQLQEQIIMQNNSYSSTLYQMYQNLQQQHFQHQSHHEEIILKMQGEIEFLRVHTNSLESRNKRLREDLQNAVRRFSKSSHPQNRTSNPQPDNLFSSTPQRIQNQLHLPNQAKLYSSTQHKAVSQKASENPIRSSFIQPIDNEMPSKPSTIKLMSNKNEGPSLSERGK